MSSRVLQEGYPEAQDSSVRWHTADKGARAAVWSLS